MKKTLLKILINIIILLITINNIKISDYNYQKENKEIKDNENTISINNNTYILKQTSNNTYYLNHDNNDNESIYGSIFLDYRCNLEINNNNCIIYGHSSKTYNLPFNKLTLYQDESYLNNNKLIKIKYNNITYYYEIIKYTNYYEYYENVIYIQTCNQEEPGYIILIAKKIENMI